MRAALALLLLALAGPGHALELNEANAAQLDALRGIGPGLSTPMLAGMWNRPVSHAHSGVQPCLSATPLPGSGTSMRT